MRIVVALGTTPSGMHGGEWGNELYYSHTVTNNGPAAVFTARTTLLFF